MNTRKFMLALLGASAMAALGTAQAYAQEAGQPADAVVEQAAPTAEEAAAQAAFLQAQLEALQAQVDALKQSVKEASKPAEPKTKIGGTMFFNVSSINQKSNGTKQATNGFQTDVKRFYVSVDHKFDDVFSANVTTDFNYVSNDSQTQVYLKKAFLQAKLDDALNVRVGSTDLPWVPFVEKLYGYRYVENILIDRTKYGTSADWGVHAFGSFADGMVNYAVSAVNGAGYKKLSRSKTVDFEGRLSFNPIKEITLGVGGYTGKLGKNIEGIGTQHTATRLNAVAAYTTDKIHVGGEYFTAKNWNNVTTVAEDKSEGWSGFAAYQVTKQVGVFGRYDWVKPSKLINPALRDTYFNVGVSYAPIKGVELALVYKRDKAKNGTLSTSNGTIGGSTDGIYDEVGIWSQVKF